MSNQRISRNELYMGLAILSSKRSICERLQVGAVLVKDNRIIANSYNGLLPGSNDHCTGVCDTTKSCTKTLHAEQNLISFCAKEGISMKGCLVVLTDSPCLKCFNLLIQSGITEIIFHRAYRITGHLYGFGDIKITQYEPKRRFK